jgi:hypothetical protein
MSGLTITILATFAASIVAGIAMTVRARMKKKSRPRLVEQPNSAYTPKLVLDRDAQHRWHRIPLEQIHEINRGEVERLLDRVTAAGVDSLRRNEREFLDNLAARLVPDDRPVPLPPPDGFASDAGAGIDAARARAARQGELHPPL